MAGISWKELLSRVQSFDIVREAETVVTNEPEKIIEAIQEQLYQRGEDSTGKKLSNYKSKAYAKKKHGMNPLPGYGVPDFKLTGNTYNGMKVQSTGDRFEVVSGTPYFPKLVKDRGENTMKMQEQNKNVYRKEVLYPGLREALARVTGLAIKNG